jgi:hypothetical protein
VRDAEGEFAAEVRANAASELFELAQMDPSPLSASGVALSRAADALGLLALLSARAGARPHADVGRALAALSGLPAAQAAGPAGSLLGAFQQLAPALKGAAAAPERAQALRAAEGLVAALDAPHHPLLEQLGSLRALLGAAAEEV